MATPSPRRPFSRLIGLFLLVACGGTTAPTPPPAPPPPPPPPGIGPAGGTVSGPAGAQVVIPAGALSAATAVTVAQSSVGAPALPAGLATLGPMFAFTPHGTTFSIPATVTVPFDPAMVPAGQAPILYKTTAGQAAWERVAGATVGTTTITAPVSSFSYFVIGSAPPSITQQPLDASVTEPAPAAFSVVALGFPPFSYQWQRSTDAGATWAAAPGASATTASYTTPPTTAAADHNARYRVQVSNPDGPTTSAVVTLTVLPNIAAPTIQSQPGDVTVAPGGNATFTVVAAGASPTYQWERSNANGPFAPVTGATNASLTLTSVQVADNGARFQAVVTNAGGSVTSRAALLTVEAAPPPPPPPPSPSGGRQIAAGMNYSAYRGANGNVVSWGSDEVGQLGAGPGDQTRSVAGPVVTGTSIAAIGAGAAHFLMVRADGTGSGTGYNGFGQLADNTFDSKSTPSVFRNAAGGLIAGLTDVCGGVIHSLALRGDGTLLAMGGNHRGQLGTGANSGSVFATQVPLGSANIRRMACGGNFSVAVTDDGRMLTWGDNDFGQLGDNSTAATRDTPLQLAHLGSPVVAVAAGQSHALALLANGTLWAWGSNSSGQIGPFIPIGGLARGPIMVTGLPGTASVVAISARGDNSAAVLDDGRVLVWGSNETGQLGRGGLTPGFSATPAAANLPGGCAAVEVAVGGGHVLARCASGALYGWGWNDMGQLGLGGAAAGIVATPAQILIP